MLLFEHHLPEGRPLPDWHDDKIARLLALPAAALAPLFPPGRERERELSARVLWAALHGICSLEAGRKLSEAATLEDMVATLIGCHVRGLAAASGRWRPAGESA